MVDKIDIAQNKAIKSVEDRLDDLEERLSEKPNESLVKRVANLEADVKALSPLLQHMTQILRYFGVHQ